jgi:hypothetical protein
LTETFGFGKFYLYFISPNKEYISDDLPEPMSPIIATISCTQIFINPIFAYWRLKVLLAVTTPSSKNQSIAELEIQRIAAKAYYSVLLTTEKV